jgi:hypothetical protein
MKKLVKTMAMLGLFVPSIFAQNTPPALICPAPVNLDCTPTNGATLTLTAMVSDAQMNALTVLWLVDGNRWQTNNLGAGNTLNPVPVTFTAQFQPDEHDVQVIVSDGLSEVSCTTQVDIRADVAPEIHSLTATPNVLWPPNHKMRQVVLNLDASDCQVVTSRVVSVRSSEPVRRTGVGDLAPDWVIGTNGMSLLLRAERSGQSRNGRIYTITVEVSDGTGNATNRTVRVTVPHSNSPKPHPSLQKPPKKPKTPTSN